MSKLVPGIGPKNAKICLLGEAPGQDEEIEGEPFVGRAGQLLNGWLKRISIRREDCYIDNVMQVRPPNNKFSLFYKDSGHAEPVDELLEGRKRLCSDLLKIQPNVIVAFGNEPLTALTGKWGITKWRGSILPTNMGKVIPVIHPAGVLRTYPWGALCLCDLRKVKRESLSPVYKEPFQWSNFTIVETVQEAILLLKEACNAEYAALDLETIYGTRHITHFGFCYHNDRAVSIPFTSSVRISKETTKRENKWSKGDEKVIWGKIKELCESRVKKIIQNAAFDVPVLMSMGIEVNNLWMDTMEAQCVKFPEFSRAPSEAGGKKKPLLGKGLDVLCSLHTDIPYYYDLKRSGWRDYCLYNALDCLAAYRIAFELEKDLMKDGSGKVYFEMVHPTIIPGIVMQEKGLRCDHEWREQECKKLEETRDKLQAELNKSAGEIVYISSPKKMHHYLYVTLGLPKQYHKVTKKVTANEETIMKLAKKFPRPEFDIMIKLRHMNKLIGTYYKNLFDSDGRIRCSWDVHGTVTGRWTSSKTAFGTGMDLQNIPIPDRRMVIPDTGKEFTYADLAQADARVVAWESQDPTLMQIFKDGKDLHKIVASSIFGISEDEVTTEHRNAGKDVGHASNYKAGPRQFANIAEKRTVIRLLKQSARDPTIKIDIKGSRPSEALARKQQAAYYGRFYKIPLWHLKVEKEVRTTRAIQTPLGRVRQFYDRINDKSVREGINQVAQETVAFVLDMIIARVWASLPKGADLLLQNHDAILVQHRPDQRELVKDIILRASDIIILNDLYIPMEIAHGNNWRDAH